MVYVATLFVGVACSATLFVGVTCSATLFVGVACGATLWVWPIVLIVCGSGPWL